MLANILMGLIILGGMAYGGYLMLCLDHFVGDEKKAQERQPPEKPRSFRAVIFGGSRETATIGEWLEEKGLNPIYMEELCLKKEWGEVKCVVALSDADADNLSVCNLMHRMYHAEQLFSICNDRENEAVYQRFKVRIIGKDRIMEDLSSSFSGNEVSIA